MEKKNVEEGLAALIGQYAWAKVVMPNNLGWDTLIIISEDVIGHICELGNSKMYHVHLVAVADDKLIKSCFARRMNDAIKEVKKVINKSQIEANASID